MTRKLPNRRYEEMKGLAADLIEDYALAYPLDPLEVAAVLGVQVTIHPLGLPASAVVAAGTADGYTVAIDSAHGRVTRVLTNRVPQREHDLRILSGASRRIGDNRPTVFGDWWESA